MLKTAFIGAGWIARQHAKAVSETGGKIVGVLDINAENARLLAEQYQARAIGAIEEVLDEVDAIHLLTPPSKRLEYVKKAAAAGKHLFIEKPIATSVEEAREIIGIARAANVKLMIGFNHRFREGYRMLKNAVDEGQLGEAINAFSYRMGAGTGFGGTSLTEHWRTNPNFVCGMSVESLSHDIDMLLNLVGGVKSVCANVYGSIDVLPEFDNNSNVSFKLANGGVGLIHASWSSHLKYGARGIVGTRGSAMIRGQDQWDFTDFVIKTEKMAYQQTTHVGEVGGASNFRSYCEVNRHFFHCVENDVQPMTTGEDGLRALIFSRAILDSARTGRHVEVNL